MIRRLVLLLLPILPAGVLHAQSAEEAFKRGNEYYQSGQFEQAAVAYESILKAGLASGEVYFNLGNACYRQNKLGAAVLAYERAARLRPDDPDLRHNLRLVYLKTTDRIEPVPELFLVQWMRSAGSILSFSAALALFLAGWIALFLVLAVMLLPVPPVVVRIGRWSALVCVLVVIGAGLVMAFQQVKDSSAGDSIIMAPVVTAKSSPDERSVDAFVIHEGLKVKVSDAVGGWIKITLPDGKVGWMPAGQLERI